MIGVIEWIFSEDQMSRTRIAICLILVMVLNLASCGAFYWILKNTMPRAVTFPKQAATAHKATLGQHILALGLKPNEELVFKVGFETVSGFSVTAYDGKFEQSVGAGPESAIASDSKDKAFELATEALRTVRMSSEAWPSPVPPAGTPEAAEMQESLHAAHESYMRSRK